MSRQSFQTLVATLFVISGATGLIYQILWFKYLSLFLGNTTYAQTMVLAAFMGGLAIGSAILGKKADRLRNPLSLYALLEFCIGAYCLMYPSIIGIAKNLFFQAVMSAHLSADGSAVLLLKLLASLVTLLPPTILMGGTLPILVKTVSGSVEESGHNVAALYFINSAGAVAGSILCGFFFIPSLGLRATMYAAAVVNIILGLLAFALSRREPAPLGADQSNESGAGRTFTRRESSVAIAVAGISGMAAMIYEVCWVRLLVPVFGSSTASFSLMLVAFICGITIGSWVVSKSIRSIRNLFSFLSLCQLGVALGLFATLPVYGRIPYIFWQLSTLVTKSASTYPIFLSIEFLVCFVIMIVPTIFLGMTLPVASRIATASVERLGSSVGNVFSVNTLGTVAGSLGAGLVLIPAFGVRHAIEIGIGLNLFAALLVLLNDRGRSTLRKAMHVAVAVAAAVIYLSAASDWNQLVMLSGVFRHVSERQAPPRTFRQFAANVQDKKDLYYREGTTATVAVVEAVVRGIPQRILLINGKGDASSVGDLSTQILLGQLPMLLHRNAESALVIGLGSGVTAGSILTHPVKSVECVEISPEVVEASACFAQANHNALADARLAVHTEDALAYLHLARKKFDVIVSEPSNPWIAGIGNLYTTEFFRACKNSLNAGGIMAQWFHIYEIDDDILKLVMRTFCGSFANVTLWQTMSDDIVLLGSDSPVIPDIPRLRERLGNEKIKTDLSRIMINNVTSLLSVESLSDGQCREYADYGELNTEDKPTLEYASPRAFFLNAGVPEFLTYDERLKYDRKDLFLQAYTAQYGLTDNEKLEIGMLQASPWWGNERIAYSLLSQYNKRHPSDERVLLKLAEFTEQLGRVEESISYWKKLSLLEPDNPSIISKYAWLAFAYHRPPASALAPYDAGESELLLRRCIALSADTVERYHIILGDVCMEDQRFAEATAEYKRAADLLRSHDGDPHVPPDVLFAKVAKASYYSGQYGQALEYAAQSSLRNPENEEVKELIYKIVMKQSELYRTKAPTQ